MNPRAETHRTDRGAARGRGGLEGSRRLDDGECIGDDLRIEGTHSFLDLPGAKEGETVIFAWVVFDGSRTAWGGFRSIVRLPGPEVG